MAEDQTSRCTAPVASSTAASAPAAARRIARADDASKVAKTMEDIVAPRRAPTSSRERNEFLKAEAIKTQSSRGSNGKSGARGRLKGHLFEDLDIEAHNAAAKPRGSELRKRDNPRQQTYDADRFIDGQYAGSVQHKSSAAGADSAIAKMEKSKRGSAKKGTIRVPADQVEETCRRADGRARVQGSDITTEKLETTLDRGLDGLAKHGVAATSKARAVSREAGKAAALSAGMGAVLEARALAAGEMSHKRFASNRARDAGEAAVATSATSLLEKVGKPAAGGRAIAQRAARSATMSVVVSSLRDIPAVARGELSGRDFAENRTVDAAETAASVALGSAATGAVLATATGAAGAAALGANAASAATAAAGAVGGMGGAGAAAAATLGAVSAAAAGPAIVGGAIMLGTGLAVGRLFKVLRRKVAQQQAARREVERATGPMPHGNTDTVEVDLVLRGRAVFTGGELAYIRTSLGLRAESDRREARMLIRQLREIEFYVSDWARPGRVLTVSEFDRLVTAGLISQGAEG